MTQAEEVKKVFVIGDSISIHYGLFLEKMVSGRFEYARKGGDGSLKDLELPADANGGDSRMVLAYIRQTSDLARFGPDIVLVNCGLHDIKRRVDTGNAQITLTEYRSNLARIVESIRALQSEMLWIRTTPVVDEIHNARIQEFHRYASDQVTYNRAADHVMRTAQVPEIDLEAFTLSIGPVETLFCDHVHFVDAVREAQAAFIAGFLHGYVEHPV